MARPLSAGLVEALRLAGERDLRLGQLMSNLQAIHRRDLFYVENDDLERMIRAYLASQPDVGKAAGGDAHG